VYSLRATPYPTASTPVTWDEVAKCAKSGDPTTLRFLGSEVIERLDRHGDLFAPLLDATPKKTRKKAAKKP
jgi:bifunctional non-homologous end joining protein LigD